ncbi:ArsO family NAD(P)H-dependent flavin-containing monooxygenase [Saccharopolyspora sp. CA-218241]|uniref:ArsO family NAD(P)H-dependent flavin-containing monooxygenase n=1 Tax=Saccharopolyspora sp. CA-218241 TaxID=3240027 RepID=UPI003D96A8F4
MELAARADDREVVVIGGGQAGLAASYFLRRAGVDFAVLDAASAPGGAWRHGWDSLRLFSPARYSPLPGWWMPEQPGEEFPTAGHVADYLAAYERRYELPVLRPVRVRQLRGGPERLTVDTDRGTWRPRAVISATGTRGAPHRPHHPGLERFTGRVLHSADYRSPADFRGQRVLVIGGGNSAAQILAELSTVADTTWATRRPPRFMPDDVDGRVLFDLATARHAARRAGLPDTGGPAALGDIVVVPPVRAARERGALRAEPMPERFTGRGAVWPDGSERPFDAVLQATGFRPDLSHLAPLLRPGGDGRIATEGTRSLQDPRVHLLGYGDWTGWASATVVGAARTAKAAVAGLTALLREARARSR